MRDPKSNSAPYLSLGNRLRRVREHKRETLAEAAGAVEIEPEFLDKIEAGTERPTEDILMLLINHFNVADNEAVQLWQEAGYEPDAEARGRQTEADKNTAVIVLALDMRTQYSDSLNVEVSGVGVTMNFGVKDSASGRTQPVARLGMSPAQAEVVLRTLQIELLKSRYLQGPKLLPPGN